jgi:anti-sigma factor RsiW
MAGGRSRPHRRGSVRRDDLVNSDTYIQDYLAAHADGELAGDELRAAEEHVAGCAECRERLAEERALKRMLREHAAVAAPAALRERMAAVLDAEDAAAREAARQAAPPRRTPRAIPRARIWIPAAIAALLMVAFIADRGHRPAEPRVPTFDAAIERLETFKNHFEPNVPSDTPAHISEAYIDHNMPGVIWDFHRAGYHLIGGRLDRMPDGRPAAFTFYRSGTDAILCTYVEIPSFAPPLKPAQAAVIRVFYRYRGYSFCVTKLDQDGYYCILVSRGPMQEFRQVVSASR